MLASTVGLRLWWLHITLPFHITPTPTHRLGFHSSCSRYLSCSCDNISQHYFLGDSTFMSSTTPIDKEYEVLYPVGIGISYLSFYICELRRPLSLQERHQGE